MPTFRLVDLGVYGFDRHETTILAALVTEDPLLLVGRSGTGKTFLLNTLSEALGLEHRHYNASLISFDDLVGFPYPDEAHATVRFLETPATMWGAESVLIDELSRCKPEHQNRLFSLVHERRLQGLPLSRLRYRWVAMNPCTSDQGGTEDYSGSEALDAALCVRDCEERGRLPPGTDERVAGCKRGRRQSWTSSSPKPRHSGIACRNNSEAGYSKITQGVPPGMKPAVTEPSEFDRISNAIVMLRGQRVLLDRDLAQLYGVETRRLNEQVRRNKQRFPADFIFEVSDQEARALISQFATSRRGGTRKRPLAFTEHGAIMAAQAQRDASHRFGRAGSGQLPFVPTQLLLQVPEPRRRQPLRRCIHPGVRRHEDDGPIPSSRQQHTVDVLPHRQWILERRAILARELNRPVVPGPQQVRPPGEQGTVELEPLRRELRRHGLKLAA
jgi:hypothetical protein